MFDGPIRGGTRGGQGEFKWSDVSADKDRENYLGHSINAPTGRWQKNKDVHWYNRDLKLGEAERLAEIRRIKEAEEEALAVALGFKPAVRPTEGKEGQLQSAVVDEGPPKLDALKKEKDGKESKEERQRRKEERRQHKEEKRMRKDARRARKLAGSDEEEQMRHRDRALYSRALSPSRRRRIPSSRSRSPGYSTREDKRGRTSQYVQKERVDDYGGERRRDFDYGQRRHGPHYDEGQHERGRNPG